MSTEQSEPTLEQRAFHEAGHVVFYVMGKIPFEYVSIDRTTIEEQEVYGHVKEDGGKTIYCPWGNVPVKLQAKVEAFRDAMMWLAGAAAEHKKTGQGCKGDWLDERYLNRCLRGMEESDEGRRLVDAWLRQRVRDVLDKPKVWAAVEALAGELIKKPCGERCIDSGQAGNIVRGELSVDSEGEGEGRTVMIEPTQIPDEGDAGNATSE